MFLKVKLTWNVIIPADSLDARGLLLQRAIMIKLLQEFARRHSHKDLGYHIALTTVDNIGEGQVREHTGEVLFPVAFTALTFRIFRGEVVEGVVHKVFKHGVFLQCGPLENVYLSCKKMPGYNYVPGENPEFINEKMPKIGKDVTVRFMVIGTKWMEGEREFQALVSLEGDYLGPVA
ncbi:DNA-directed RNA polymerase V subunit 7 [Linum grandiflorum]